VSLSILSPLLLKALHVLGVVLMLGNVIVTGFWNFKAVRTRDARVIAFAQREVIAADYGLTFGGGALLSVSGFLLAQAYGLNPWTTPWIVGGFGLLGLSTLLWLIVLVPCQSRMARLSHAARDDAPLPPAFYRAFWCWNVVGWFATLLLVAALALMVLKPH
jgi:uncharacterized membrane protein